MMTNILGFLIIFGALLILIVRYLTHKHEQPLIDQHEMRDATAQLKKELQHTGDEVVARLSDRVAQLETLLAQAEDKQAALSAKVDESRRLENELTLQSEELKALRQQLAALQATATMAAQLPVRQAAAVAPADESVDGAAVAEPAASGRAAAASPDAAGRAPADMPQDFAAVLQQSLAREPGAAPASGDLGQYQTYADSVQAAGLAAVMHEHPEADSPATGAGVTSPAPADSAEPAGVPTSQPGPAGEPEDTADTAASDDEAGTEGSAAAKARALLLSGYSIEDTARETGLGQGAVMLIREMSRRELEK